MNNIELVTAENATRKDTRKLTLSDGSEVDVTLPYWHWATLDWINASCNQPMDAIMKSIDEEFEPGHSLEQNLMWYAELWFESWEKPRKDIDSSWFGLGSSSD